MLRSSTAPLFLLSLLCAPAFAKTVSVPDWVQNAAAQKLPDYSPETDAVVLLDDTTYTVAADGSAIEHNRRVVKILRPQGRDEGIVGVSFDKDSKILSMHVWSIGPDGHEYTVKDNEMIEVGYSGQGNLFADDRVRSASAPGRDPGGIVACEYEQRVHPYLTEKTWFFQHSIPVLSQSFTLQLPPGYTHGEVWAHAKETPAVDLEQQRWRWQMQNTPAVDLNRVLYRPSVASLEGRMTVHYAGSGIPVATQGTWQSIGEWYQTLAKDRLASTPEIAAKAQELTAGKTGFYDKAEAIAVFLQTDIRYFAIEMGIGGYQPHYAADIFRNRYGDCKDKATLLSAMLSSVGIHSALVMVDTSRNVIDPTAPSIVGNHMIAAIEIPAGYSSPKLHSVITAHTGKRYLIFDPTWEKTPFGQLEHNLQGSYGVLLEGPDSEIVRFPVLDPALNFIHRTASLHLAADGTLTGTVTEKRFGDLSEDRRALYTRADAKQQSDFLDHLLAEDFNTFQVSGFQVENVQSLSKDLTTTYTLTAAGFGRPTGSLLMVRPRVLGSDALRTDHKPRTVPIDLHQTMQEQDDFAIELPPGYVVDELPNPVSLDLGFASYSSAIAVTGNTLHYTRTWIVREVTEPADRYADLQKLAEAIGSDEQSTAILKKQ